MSAAEPDLRRDAIRATLTQRAGGNPDAGSIAQATLDTWQQVAERLVPVIGPRGVDALLGRALHLTSKSFPWLAMTGSAAESALLLAGLKTRLAGGETTAAAQAGLALLATFVELLATLIGASLTERLLTPVWVSASSETLPKIAS
jgi:hypothetical protein